MHPAILADLLLYFLRNFTPVAGAGLRHPLGPQEEHQHCWHCCSTALNRGDVNAAAAAAAAAAGWPTLYYQAGRTLSQMLLLLVRIQN